MRLKILLCLISSLWVSDVSYASENIPKETSESSPVTPIAAPALASGALSQMPDPKTFVKKQWPAPERTLLSHVELIIMHAMLSHLVMNTALYGNSVITEQKKNPISWKRRGAGIAAMIVGGVASGWLSSEYSLTNDDVALFNKTALWGFFDGYLLLQIIKDKDQANDDDDNLTDPESRPRDLFPLLGYGAGVALALVVYNSVDDQSLHAGQINAASWIGIFSGVFAGSSMVNYSNRNIFSGYDGVSEAVLLVSNLGVAAGLFLFNDYPISESRVSLVAASGILLGGLAAVGGLAYTELFDHSYSSAGKALAFQLGSLVGLVGGWFLTSQWDDDWIPDEVSDMHMGVMPNEHGGMMGTIAGRW